MRSIYFIISIAVLLPFVAYAQHEPQITHHMFGQNIFNPAYAGREDNINALLLYRSQWSAFEGDGNPSTQVFNINAPLLFIPGGAGLTVINDMIGVERSTYFNISYAYQVRFAGGRLGMGLSAGAIQKALDGSKLRAPQGSYANNVDHNDILIPNTFQSAWAPDVSAGIFYELNDFHAGVSSTHLTEGKAGIKTVDGRSRIAYSRAYYLNAGYDMELSEKFTWQPSALLKTDLNNFQVDFNTIFLYNRNIYLGAAFRGYNSTSIDALIIMLGVRIAKNFTVGYAYDASLSEINQHNFGSHEIIVSYKMPVKGGAREGKIIYNPRFL